MDSIDGVQLIVQYYCKQTSHTTAYEHMLLLPFLFFSFFFFFFHAVTYYSHIKMSLPNLTEWNIIAHWVFNLELVYRSLMSDNLKGRPSEQSQVAYIVPHSYSPHIKCVLTIKVRTLYIVPLCRFNSSSNITFQVAGAIT